MAARALGPVSLVRTSRLKIEPKPDDFYFDINCELQYEDKVLFPVNIKIFNYQLNSKDSPRECLLYEYHQRGYEGCQFIGFFDSTFNNNTFNSFNKVNNTLLITNVDSYEIIDNSNYDTKIPKDNKFYCGKLEYAQTEITNAYDDKHIEDWAPLSGEYVIVGNKLYPICVVTYDKKSGFKEIPGYERIYDMANTYTVMGNIEPTLEHKFIRYLLSNSVNKIFDISPRISHKFNINCVITDITLKKNGITYGKNNIEPGKSLPILMKEYMNKLKENPDPGRPKRKSDDEEINEQKMLKLTQQGGNSNIYYVKYLKYKQKYLDLKKLSIE